VKNVLVIDDEKLTRQLCSDILSREGFSVLTAENASEGFRRVQESPVDVILLDIMMPGLSGLEALRILSSMSPEIPVIVVTAHSSSQVAIEALKYGAYDFITKPFPNEELINGVRRALERRRLLVENRRLLEELRAKVEELSRLYMEAEGFASRLEERVRERTKELEALLAENARLYRQVEEHHRELVSSKQLLDNILSHMSSGLLLADMEGRIRTINRPGEETLGCPKEKVLGHRLVDLFPNSQPLLEVRPEAVSQEIDLELPDGRTIPLGFSNSFLFTEDGHQEGIIVVFRDLSEIKRLRGEVLRRDRLATIGEVAAGVAHEIRNPLFGITSVAQVLAREVPYNEAQRELIAAMLSETKRLNALVDDLLLYGRPTKLSPVLTDLSGIWEEILGLMEEGMEQRQIKVIRNYDKGLPLVYLDRDKIKQVFLNLFNNAMEATPDRGTIKIETRMVHGSKSPVPRPEENFVEVSVSDTGPGIPQEHLEKVFDLFFTTKPRGSGLGLAICRKIVEDHRGSIEARSGPGEGTTFTLKLPLDRTLEPSSSGGNP